MTLRRPKQARKYAREVCEEFGIYDDMAEIARKQWEEWRKLPREQWPGYKKGLPPWKQKGVSAKRYKDSLERKVQHRNETVAKERRRILFGLEQQTNIHLVRTMTRNMISVKSRAVCTRGIYRLQGTPNMDAVRREYTTQHGNRAARRSHRAEGEAHRRGILAAGQSIRR